MNIYIIIQNGVTCKTCYTSIKTVANIVKGPHLNTIYRNIKASGLYSRNGLVIQELTLEKLPNRNKDHKKNLIKPQNLRTNDLGSDYSSGIDRADRNTYRDE